MAQREVREFFVVHRGSEGTKVLARLFHGTPHRRLLDPYLSQLVHASADGMVLLVDADTREPVLRCLVEESNPRRRETRRRALRFWLL